MNAKRTRPNAPGPKTNPQFRRIDKSTVEIVRAAAELLDEELAAGILAARRMQKRFDEERRIDPKDFDAAVQKLRTDSHGLIGLLESQFREMKSEEHAALIERLVGQSHGLIDVFFSLAGTAAEIANHFAQSTRDGPETPARDKSA